MATHNKRGGPYTCPSCGSANVRVYDTVGVKDDRRLLRRRICEDCGRRWRTVEMDADDYRELSDCARIIGEIKKKMRRAEEEHGDK